MRVYLDDDRKAPQGWVQVRWVSDAQALVETGLVTELSLDYLLGDHPGTGLDVLHWIEERVQRGARPPLLFVHATDNEHRRMMEKAIISIYRTAGRKGSVMWTLRAKALQWKSNHKGV